MIYELLLPTSTAATSSLTLSPPPLLHQGHQDH
jgi:hypothetical protein